MKKGLGIVLAATLLAGAKLASAQNEFKPDTILAIMQRVAAYRMNDATMDNSWGFGGTYYPGIMAVYDVTKQSKYLTAATNWAKRYSWKPFQTDLTTNGDNQTCFQTYAEIYLLDSLAANNYMVQPADANFANMFDKAPLASRRWAWLDLMYMAPAGIARVSQATHKPRYLDSMNVYWQNSASYYFDQPTGLYYRDNNNRVNHPGIFWARGCGWIFGGLARVIPFLPANYAARSKFVTQFQGLAAALKPLQQSSGLWTSDLTHPSTYPQKETSGSSFYCYGMAWGINAGLLDRATYEPVVRKAWTALVGCINANGSLGWVQGPASTPAITYASGNQPYAEGTLMLAGREMYKLYKPTALETSDHKVPVVSESAKTVVFLGLRGERLPIPEGATGYEVYTIQGSRILSRNLVGGAAPSGFIPSSQLGDFQGSRIVRFQFR